MSVRSHRDKARRGPSRVASYLGLILVAVLGTLAAALKEWLWNAVETPAGLSDAAQTQLLGRIADIRSFEPNRMLHVAEDRSSIRPCELRVSRALRTGNILRA